MYFWLNHSTDCFYLLYLTLFVYFGFIHVFRVRFEFLTVYQGPNPVSAAGHLYGELAKIKPSNVGAVVEFHGEVWLRPNFVIGTLACFLLSKLTAMHRGHRQGDD